MGRGEKREGDNSQASKGRKRKNQTNSTKTKEKPANPKTKAVKEG